MSDQPRLTLAAAKAICAALGFSLRRTVGSEVRLARPGRNQEAAAHYTDDLDDAIGTARAEAARAAADCGPRIAALCLASHAIAASVGERVA